MRKLGQTGKIIAIAAALGLVTAVLVYLYVSGLAAVPEAEPVQLAQVVIAKQDLTPRTVITPDVVRIAQVPVDTIHPKAAISISQVNGRVVKSSILAGEPVLTDRLVPAGETPSLAFAIPIDRRAVTISVNEVVGVAGFVQPGDRVDVLASFEGESGETTSVVVLQNTEVLAIAQTMESDIDAKPRVVATVTLAVTLEEAQKLYLAESKGSLRLALRPTGAMAKELTAVVTDSDLVSPRKKLEPTKQTKPVVQVTAVRPEARHQVVEVIRGTQREIVTVQK